MVAPGRKDLVVNADARVAKVNLDRRVARVAAVLRVLVVSLVKLDRLEPKV